MSKLRHILKHEMRELIPVTLFFFVSFQLLALTEALILKQYEVEVSTFVAATLMAMIIAKAVVLTDHIAFVHPFTEKAPVYNIAWRTTIYFAASLVLRYLEQLFHAWRRSPGFTEANRRLFEEIIWPHFWAVQLWLLVLLLIYCAYHELVKALGRERLTAVFFDGPAHLPLSTDSVSQISGPSLRP